MTPTTARCACDRGPVPQPGRLPHPRSLVTPLAGAGLLFLALASFTTHAGSDLGGWVPVWSDEFDYRGKPDPSKWTVLDRPDAPADNVFVDGSTLNLQVDKNGIGANVGTGNTTSIRYQGDYGMKYLLGPGRLDVKASAILLPGIMNIAWGSTDWSKSTATVSISGEIDIFEILGVEPDRVYMTSHLHRWFNAPTGERNDSPKGAVVRDSTLAAFHTYTVEWDDAEIRMYFDGVLKATREHAEDPDSIIFGAPRPLILSVYHVPKEHWGFSKETLNPAKLPAYMKIDYVRYYQCRIDHCRHGGLLASSDGRIDMEVPGVAPLPSQPGGAPNTREPAE